MEAVLAGKTVNLRAGRLERAPGGLFDVTVTDAAGRIVHIERGVSFRRGADIIEEQMFQ